MQRHVQDVVRSLMTTLLVTNLLPSIAVQEFRKRSVFGIFWKLAVANDPLKWPPCIPRYQRGISCSPQFVTFRVGGESPRQCTTRGETVVRRDNDHQHLPCASITTSRARLYTSHHDALAFTELETVSIAEPLQNRQHAQNP